MLLVVDLSDIVFNKNRACCIDVLICFLEISCVPRIFDFGCFQACRLHKQEYFVVGIFSYDISKIAGICTVHYVYYIVISVVVTCYLAGCMVQVRYSVCGEYLLCRWIDVVSYFLATCCSRCYFKSVSYVVLFCEVFHYVFRHRTTADVTMTYKEYSLFHIVQVETKRAGMTLQVFLLFDYRFSIDYIQRT